MAEKGNTSESVWIQKLISTALWKGFYEESLIIDQIKSAIKSVFI